MTAAPARDFNRRANSIEREALPKGLFPGTSKKLYDALYLRTRGAVVPRTAIQATKRQLMEWSGIRSKNTVAVNLQILTANGLLVRNLEVGDHEGSVYEVRLPEEIGAPILPQPNPTQPDPTRQLGGDPTQQSGWAGPGKLVESKGDETPSKTSFKTNTERSDDDEAFAALHEVERELTGRSAGANQWREVAEVLATELRIAAARTTVSSVPAFLAEHLRRRLFKKDRRQLAAEEASAPAASPLPAGVDVKTCPDCQGSGYYYPEGFEKGVARCQHAGLRKAEG